MSLDPLTASLLDLVLPAAPAVAPAQVPDSPAAPAGPTRGWPCLACQALNDFGRDSCQECGKPFLAGSIPDVALVLPVVGDLTKLSRAQRAGLAAAIVLAVLLPLALLTFLTTGAPPKDAPSTTPGTTVSQP